MASNRRWTVAQASTLLPYLLGTLGLKRKAIKDLLKHGAVAVNGNTVRQFDHALLPGDEVALGDVQAAAAGNRFQQAGIQLFFEDEALIVVDKPAGLLTVATDFDKTDTLYVRLNDYLRNREPAHPVQAFVVHRLDRETSGLVLFAKSAQIKRQLQAAWPLIEKTYYAIVAGRPEPAQDTITSYLRETKSLTVHSSANPLPGARKAVTHYRVLQTQGGWSLLEICLETGRKHQIRVHLAARGHPVAGDQRYGTAANPCGRLALHAARLALRHPLTSEPLRFSSPLPAAMRRLFSETLE